MKLNTQENNSTSRRHPLRIFNSIAAAKISPSFLRSSACLFTKKDWALLVIQSNKSNKMLQIIWHHFSVQFSLIFQMVYSVLPSVLHFKTSLLVDPDWLLKVFHQSGVGVSKGNTASKMEHSTWKSNENWTENWCHIVCSILSGLFLCVTSSEQSLQISPASIEWRVL